MKYGGVFMQNAQKKTSDAQKRANLKYANSRWRPNIYIDADKRECIEKWLFEHEYKSINEYLLACLKKDEIIE